MRTSGRDALASWPVRRPQSSPPYRRALVHGLVLAGLLFAAYLFVIVAPLVGTLGFDAYAYWSVDLANPYAATAGALGAFPYTPVAARFFAMFGGLEWLSFLWLWLALLVGTIIWLGWRSALLVLAFPPVALELYHGNVNLPIAAALALGFRYPAFYCVPLLTKVTPGIGLLWFAARAEWRPLLIAGAVSGGLVLVSLVFDGHLWSEWLASISTTASGSSPTGQPEVPIPIWMRLPAAALLVVWGARTNRPWTVPAAACLAMPILWPTALSVLAALWPIAQGRRGVTDSVTLEASHD